MPLSQDALHRDFAKVKRPKHHLYVRMSSKEDMLSSDEIPYFAVNTAQTFPFHFGHASSETGWVGGNTTHYSITTRTNASLGAKIDRINTKLIELYPVAGRGSLQSMYDRIKHDGYQSVFVENELNSDSQLPNAENPISTIVKSIWGSGDTIQNHSILDVYAEAARLIRSAEQTIFIDMFAFGVNCRDRPWLNLSLSSWKQSHS